MLTKNEIKQLQDSQPLYNKVANMTVSELREQANTHEILRNDIYWQNRFILYFPEKFTPAKQPPQDCYFQYFLDAYDEIIKKAGDESSTIPHTLSTGLLHDLEFLYALANGPHYCPSNLYEAEYYIRNNEEIIRKFIKKDPWYSLSAASDKIKDDIDMVKIATDLKPSAIAFASERIRGLRKVMEPLIKKDAGLLNYASRELRDNEELVKVAICYSTGYIGFNYASERLQKNDQLKKLVEDPEQKKEFKKQYKKIQEQRHARENRYRLAIFEHKKSPCNLDNTTDKNTPQYTQ